MKMLCPKCRKILSFQDGLRVCEEHGDFGYSKNQFYDFETDKNQYFDTHWGLYERPRIGKQKKHGANVFLSRLFQQAEPTTFLDVGVGEGVHLAHLEKRWSSTQLHGLDISKQSLVQTRNVVKNATLVRASVDNMPYYNASFDCVISFGVLGYVKDIDVSLREINRVLAPGGRFGIWVYPKREDFLGKLFLATRLLVPRLPTCMQRSIAAMIVPLLKYLPTVSQISLRNSTWNECMEVVMVNIAPERLVFFSEKDLKAHLEKAGFTSILVDDSLPVTIWCQKDE